MDKVLKIFRRDLLRILRNPIALIVTLGVCVIPSLYAWFNILANWDPYKNTQDVPVAVVNKDEGADLGEMGFIDAGDMVQERLAENDQLDWEFVDEDEALEGVTSGRFYAAIVLPETFTSDLASVLSGKLTSPTITYYVNEKLNPIAPKVTDTGATTLETQINETFVSTVTNVVVDKMQGVGDQMASETDAATTDVVARVRDVNDTLGELEGNIDDTRSTISAAQSSVGSAQVTLSNLLVKTGNAKASLAEATGMLYTARTGANSVGNDVSGKLARASAVVTRVSGKTNTAIGVVSGRIGEAQGTVDASLAQARQVANENSAIVGQLAQVTPYVPADRREEWNDLVTRLTAQATAAQEAVAKLQTASNDIKAQNNAVANLSSTVNDAVVAGSDTVLQSQGTLTSSVLPQLDSALDGFATAAGDLQSGLGGVEPTITQTQAVLTQLYGTLSDADDALGLTRDELEQVRTLLDGVATDVEALQTSEVLAQVRQLASANPTDIASFMATPVTIDEEPVFPVANYGSGVTPFYTDLALWVGGFVLVAIYKVEVDEEDVGEFKPWQGYFGRWLLFFVLGTLQGIVCTVGDLVLGIQCVNPGMFVLTGVIESFVYVNIIYAFSIAVKHIGKALCVLLVILQIPGSSGTYPIEMMPGFYQAIHPWLPFTYGINAMRECIAGAYGSYYAYNVFMLLLFVLPALLIGVGLRRHMLNINVLFDRRLAETDLMICEHDGMEVEHYRLSSLVQALMHSDDYRLRLAERVASFEASYPKRQKWLFAGLLALPIGLAVAMFVSPQPAKLPLFILWIISIVAFCTAIIVTEYLYDSLQRRKSMSDLTREQMVELLGKQLDREENAR